MSSPNRPPASTPNEQRGNIKNPNGGRSYRVIQNPARPGTISHEQAREAARWVKQNRTRSDAMPV